MPDKQNGVQSFWKTLQHFGSSLGGLLGKLFDKVIYSNKASLIMSGLFAVIFCVSISYDELNFTFFSSDTNTYNMSSVPVEVQMNTEDYEVIGMPSTADLTIEGDAVDIQLVRTQNSASVIADLRSMTEGKNVVIFKASGLPSGLNVTITPPSVEVELQRKYTVSFPVTADILTGSGRKPENFSATLSVKNVTIRATNAKLSEVRSVKAIIDASRDYSDFTVKAPLVAYDSAGKPMDVTIVPDSVDATVTINTPASTDSSTSSGSSTSSSTDNAASSSGTGTTNNNLTSAAKEEKDGSDAGQEETAKARSSDSEKETAEPIRSAQEELE